MCHLQIILTMSNLIHYNIWQSHQQNTRFYTYRPTLSIISHHITICAYFNVTTFTITWHKWLSMPYMYHHNITHKFWSNTGQGLILHLLSSWNSFAPHPVVSDSFEASNSLRRQQNVHHYARLPLESGGAGKARFNVATPTDATVTCNSIRITV